MQVPDREQWLGFGNCWRVHYHLVQFCNHGVLLAYSLQAASTFGSSRRRRGRRLERYLTSLLRRRTESCLQAFQTFHHAQVAAIVCQKYKQVQADHFHLLAPLLIHSIEARILRVQQFHKRFDGFIGSMQVTQQFFLPGDRQQRGSFVAQAGANGFIESRRKPPFLRQPFPLPDLGLLPEL